MPAMPEYTWAWFLRWIVTGGGAGLFAYWAMGAFKLDQLPPQWARLASLALATAAAALARLCEVWWGYSPAPANFFGWWELAFSAAALAVFSSQNLHGFRVLAQKPTKPTV